MRSERGALHPGPDGWAFAPEGAAVHVEERTAVLADVHLGYEWARGAGGDCVPAHALAETLSKLASLLRRAAIDRLIVAGDLVESPRPCRRTAVEVAELGRWLDSRGVALTTLAGNHDPGGIGGRHETLQLAGWTIAHGHRALDAPRTISGHLHPALRACGMSFPCFLVGPETIVLPAFSANAAGWNVAAAVGRNRPDRALRCLAATGDDVLDFGPLRTLAERLGAPQVTSPTAQTGQQKSGGRRVRRRSRSSAPAAPRKPGPGSGP